MLGTTILDIVLVCTYSGAQGENEMLTICGLFRTVVSVPDDDEMSGGGRVRPS